MCNRNKCTCWFDGWFGKSWAECCDTHDKEYMTPAGKGMTKSEVDNKLFKCVRSKGCIIMAAIMWLGNKSFSWFYWRKYKDQRNG